MGNLSVHERLKIVSELISQHKEFGNSLDLYSKILEIQQEIDSTSSKGIRLDFCAKLAIDSLQENSLKAKRPIIQFIDPSIFDYNILSSLFEKIVNVLIERNADGDSLKNFLSLVKSGKKDLLKYVEAILREDETSVRKCAEELDIQPRLLLYIISLTIQPSLEEIARNIDASFSDRWWQSFCPVCGRIPTVARVRNRKRYLVCTFCGAEYLSDHFVCVHCDNKDPYTLKYLIADEKPEFQIDFCTKCKHYIKVIDEDKLAESIPRGLEDILTLNLDIAAKNAGLVRD